MMKLIRYLLIVSLCIFSLQGNTYAQILLKDSLKAHLKLDGNTNDAISSFHGSIADDTTYTSDRFGTSDAAFYFDGINDRIELASPSLLEYADYSYSMWVKADTIPNSGQYWAMISIGSSGGDQGIWLLNKVGSSSNSNWGAHSWHTCNAAVTVRQGGSPTDDDTWHHLVSIKGDDSLSFYLDGVFIGSDATTCAAYYGTGTTVAYLGGRFNNAKYFKGALDDIKIYNRELTDDDVIALYYGMNWIEDCEWDYSTGITVSNGLITSSDYNLKRVFLNGNITTDYCTISNETSETTVIEAQVDEIDIPMVCCDTPTGYVQMGVLIDTSEYIFKIYPTSITSYINGVADSVHITTFDEGNRYFLELDDSSRVNLYVNDMEEVLLSLDIVINGKASYFLDLKGVDTKVSSSLKRKPCVEEVACLASTDFYAELLQRLDGSFVTYSDTMLQFKFNQEYETTSENTEISYNIFDWKRATKKSGTFSTNYGVNWIDIDVGSLTKGEYYNLEISANKGEKYFLRFKIEADIERTYIVETDGVGSGS